MFWTLDATSIYLWPSITLDCLRRINLNWIIDFSPNERICQYVRKFKFYRVACFCLLWLMCVSLMLMILWHLIFFIAKSQSLCRRYDSLIELNWYLLRPIIRYDRFERWNRMDSMRLQSVDDVHSDQQNNSRDDFFCVRWDKKFFVRLTGIYCSMRPPGNIPCNFGPNLRSLSNVNTTVSVKTVSSACSPCVRP